MDIKLFLIFVVILSAMHQGPASYRDLTCVEPEPGYTQRMLSFLTAREFERICPARAVLIWRIGSEVFCNLLCVLITLLLGYAPSIRNSARERWSFMVSMIKGMESPSFQMSPLWDGSPVRRKEDCYGCRLDPVRGTRPTSLSGQRS
ncbi:uncharacterized protein LOC117326898 [Pecten maximus]|uniref:uncharacterized protein LOC117326898 n=1 Tax=Pecten maximus TaxID=6579 RepID=UPI00145880F3|nr:uncharacterized protein LOC117326898 [Pecten maximus]